MVIADHEPVDISFAPTIFCLYFNLAKKVFISFYTQSGDIVPHRAIY